MVIQGKLLNSRNSNKSQYQQQSKTEIKLQKKKNQHQSSIYPIQCAVIAIATEQCRRPEKHRT